MPVWCSINSTVSSGGSLTVTGVGYSQGSSLGEYGVYLDDSTLMASGIGNNVNVTGSLTTTDYGDDVGVLVGGGSAIRADAGSVTVTGTSAGFDRRPRAQLRGVR